MAKRVPKTTTLHGVTLTDEYAWLREKGSRAVTEYLEAENAYTDTAPAPSASAAPYSSPISPASVYDYDVGTRERTLRKRQEMGRQWHDEGKMMKR